MPTHTIHTLPSTLISQPAHPPDGIIHVALVAQLHADRHRVVHFGHLGHLSMKCGCIDMQMWNEAWSVWILRCDVWVV